MNLILLEINVIFLMQVKILRAVESNFTKIMIYCFNKMNKCM